MALDIVTPIVGKIGEYLVAPLGRQLGYIIFYNKKINNFREQLEKLESLRNSVQASVVAAKRNREEIRNEVNYWMRKVDGFKLDANQFLDDDDNLNKRCFNGWLPNLVIYHRLGKKAHKKAMVAIELHRDGNFATISIPCPSLGLILMPNFVAFETRSQAMMKVMEALTNENTNFIGIHGMGGVGKTTLVREIGKKVKEEKLCEEVVMAVVSQNMVVQKIQHQIADLLDFTFRGNSDFGRAAELYERLSKVQKVLIILDDVWDPLNEQHMTEIGIPFGDDHKGCKIIITTRRKQVCSVMSMGNETTEIVHLNVLSEQESWDLFRRNVGDIINSPTLKDISKVLVKECQGLPVAIITVGRAMRGKDIDGWKNAVEDLKKSVPENIEGVDKVYGCLKFSYDHLQGEEAKSIFLLCSMFPEDGQIDMELLVRYGFGLRLFKSVSTVLQARRRANTIINNLKDSCLLMEGVYKGYVKMHDVVRDVALKIRSDKYLVRAGEGLKDRPIVVSLDRYTGISMIENEIEELPDVCKNTNIEIMLLQENKITLKGSFFEGTKALRVLDMSDHHSLWPNKSYRKILLESFCCLTSLRTLVLERFEIGDASALGQIKTLEILSLRNGSLDRPLTALGELRNLRLLDITNCEVNSDSSIILPNMFSKLSQLEELYLGETRTGWRFGSGDELKSLPRLNSFTFSIENVNSWLPEDFVFPDLERFIIYEVGRLRRFEFYEGSDGFSYDNYLEICKSNRSTGWWLNCYKPLLKNTNFLSLVNLEDISNVIPNVGVDLNELKALEVRGCIGLEYLIKTEELWILPNDQKYQQINLCNLRFVSIAECGQLKYIFHPSVAQSLQQLERITVDRCEALEEIVAKENQQQEVDDEAVDKKIVFKCLKQIRLTNLPSLKAFCTGSFPFEWPSLEVVKIENCPQIETFAAAISTTQSTLDLKSIKQQINLCNLRVVEIGICDQLKYIFHPSVAQSLQRLDRICVWACSLLEEIVAKENQQQEDDDEAVDKKIVFKCLKQIELTNLPSLKAFCTGSFPFEWPSLEKVSIEICYQMKTFVAATSTTRSIPNLKSIKLDDVEIFQPGVDFDTAMENHFKEKDGSRHRLIETGESSTSAIPFQGNEDINLEESGYRQA